MTRRCSHCSNNGHNSRTCPNRAGGVKLFGVRLTDGYIRKSASMGNLSSAHYSSSSSLNPGSPSDVHHRDPSTGEENGYASDDPSHASYSNRGSERKKGIPWTEHEHRMFLAGLQKLGKGDWRGISRNFVVSRTPTQVASHAQKYFIRQSNMTRRKRRSSLFDMAADVSMDSEPIQEEQALDQPPTVELLPESKVAFPSLHLSLDLEPEPPECAATSMESAVKAEEPPLIPLIPTFIPAFLPVPYPFWVPNFASSEEENGKSHNILRPIPVHLKEPVDVDRLLGMSTLSLAEVRSGRIEQSDLSVKLLEPSSRHSAFHPNPSFSGSNLTEKESSSKAISNEIHAV